MKLAPLALALTFTASAFSQATFTDPANLRGERVRAHDGRELPVDQGASGLQQLLRRLNTRASILNIVAHPDDEDGGMLTFYSRGLGARVADLSLTRGEGGQNAMTGDFEDALGLLRTQELLASDRYSGIDQFFGTEVDFGFSKTKEEAFAKWTHDRVLYDAVRAIRLYRPLVITATFIGGVTDGHGQHQVSGQIAQEAFKAAADPKVFPEMIAEGLLPWQALKVYARVPMQSITPKGLFDYATGQYTPAKFTNYVTGEVTTTQPSVDVVVHEGTPDALLGGKTFVQFARIGLGMQKSQIGPGVRNAPGGTFDVSYHRYGSRVVNQPAHEESFFDGIDTSLAGIADLATSAFPQLHAGLANIQADIKSAADHFDTTNPSKVAPVLADALKQVDTLIKEIEEAHLPSEAKHNVLHELRIKRVQLNDALAIALSAQIQAEAIGDTYAVNSSVPIQITLYGASESPSITRAWVENADQKTEDWKGATPVWSNKSPHIIITTTPALTHKMTRPYFTRDNIETPVYTLLDPSLRNAPQSPSAFAGWVEFTYHDVPVRVGHITLASYPEALGGPISIVPAVSVSPDRSSQTLVKGSESLKLNVNLRGTFFDFRKLSFGSFSVKHSEAEKSVSVKVDLRVPPGWSANPVGDSSSNSVATVFDVRIGTLSKSVVLKGEAIEGDATYTEGYRAVGYPGIPLTNYFTPATVRVVPVDLKLPARNKIAYLAGTGDDVPEALTSIGLKPAILIVADLTAANLAKYDTVILGVRTYNAHPDLHGAPTQALFDYARNGGNVVVQYQTTEFTAADAPYPVSLGSNEKVVDETAPVQLLEATNPLLTTPNRITPADFNSWVEERGHGFLHTWDEHYIALTETHDPGGPETQPQAPQRGGLITTPLGKGRWTYCAFALYRQLPEAVPGAYRLFVNLLNP